MLRMSQIAKWPPPSGRCFQLGLACGDVMTAYEPCADCADPEQCAVRELMRETRAALSGVLDHCSLQTLIHRSSHESWLQASAGGHP